MSYTPLYLFDDLHYEPVFYGEEVDNDDFIVEVKDYLADCKGAVDVDI